MPNEEDSSAQEPVAANVPPLPEETVNKVNSSVCARCGEAAVSFCLSCGQDFCARHRCLTHAYSRGFDVADDPLVDDEGTTRHGRRIRLIGEGWPDHIRMVNSMTDEALLEQIQGLQQLLKDAIAAQDFARICLAHAEFELEYRRHSRYVQAMQRREKIEQGAVRLGKQRRVKTSPQVQLAPDGKPIPTEIASLMTAFNINYQQACAMKILLGGAKKA